MAHNAASIVALLALVASSARAQDVPEVFGESIEVRVVNVEAVVTDRSGERVTGLQREDFRMTVDGVEVPIGFFSEIVDGTPIAGAEELPLDVGVQVGSVARVPTHFLVFIDDFFAIKAQRDMVLKRLEEQLSVLEPGDRMAVLAYDGKRLEVLSGWSSSKSDLGAVLTAARERKAGGAWRRMEKAAYLARLSGPALVAPEALGAGDDALPLSVIESRQAQLDDQIRALVTAAASGMRGLAAPPGRRAMLLLSGGWPLDTGGLSNDPSALLGTLEQRADGLELLRFQGGFNPYSPLADTANHLGFTLYPVDVAGLGWNGPGADVDTFGTGFGSERSEEAVLLRLARQTGGRALLNNLRSKALERARADTGSYYWIGFTAQVRADDKRHRIRLEVLRPGLEVRSRREYVDLSRHSETKMLVEGGLMLSGGEQLGVLSVEQGETERVARKQMRVPLTIGIPTDRITMLPSGGELVAGLEISFGVRDKRDTLSDVVTLPVKLTMPLFRPMYPEQDQVVYYQLAATLRRERHDLVVSVRDVPTGEVLSTRVEVVP